MSVPAWALALSYALHMLATVLWIGGLAAVVLLIHPAARRLPAPERDALLEAAQRRLDPVGWFCLALLTGTGLIQMSASPQYEGFLAVTNQWAVSILLKHIVFFGMAGVSAYLTWFSLPDLKRAILRQASGKTVDVAPLQARNLLLLRLNLILGIIVLIFTALARASA
ncbi:MAG TPA: CopD family protein [Anaerolineales bacterium]|nr:CopD family protein [Anaerolineales bacterium]